MKKVDPFFWYLSLVLRKFTSLELKDEEKKFIGENIDKHRGSQWISLASAVLVFLALKNMPESEIGILVMALLAPVIVMGGAWFVISFKTMPAKLISSSMSITFWMYTAFKVSITTMFVGIGFISPQLLWPVLALIYLSIDITCMQYDTADGLVGPEGE